MQDDDANFSARLEQITVADVSPASRADFERFHGPGWPSGMKVFDVIIADDDKSFPPA